MAPLPDNNTAVYFLDYTVDGQGHTMQFRLTEGADLAGAVGDSEGFLAALAPILDANWFVVGARYRAAGSNISFPVDPPTQPSVGAGSLPVKEKPRYLSFVGRGLTTGRKVRVFVYGAVFNSPDDYRLTGSEEASVQNAVQFLQNNSENTFATIGGDIPYWNAYANVGYNSYYERKARG